MPTMGTTGMVLINFTLYLTLYDVWDPEAGIDGFDVCRAIRRVSDVPIVMVTARADTHDVVAGLDDDGEPGAACLVASLTQTKKSTTTRHQMTHGLFALDQYFDVVRGGANEGVHCKILIIFAFGIPFAVARHQVESYRRVLR